MQVPTEAYVVLKDSCHPHGHTFRLRAWLTGQNNRAVVVIIQQKCWFTLQGITAKPEAGFCTLIRGQLVHVLCHPNFATCAQKDKEGNTTTIPMAVASTSDQSKTLFTKDCTIWCPAKWLSAYPLTISSEYV